ncbi:MAG: phage scaffolding protein [Peptoniphilus harei]|nr:phage scaffolding protein [Peptoniphilus harei]MDU1663757.1 phage scaffolding protein [Peptoniphilus harei]
MLSKEKLLEMGIDEGLADKILEDVNKDYVPSYRYKEVKDGLESLNSEISKRDKQIDGLKKLSGNKEELEAEINSLKEANKKAKEEAEENLKAIRKDNAITEYLYNQRVNNVGVLKKLLNNQDLKYEDEKLIGIDEQMKALREDNSLKSLFANNDFRGANPNIAGDNREKPKGLFDAVIKREDQEEKFNPWG